MSMMFQSTHPHGVRPVLTSLHEAGGFVSIHAPTRGATSVRRTLGRVYMLVSIHAPTRGATPIAGEIPSVLLEFQSTHPHGVRPDCRDREQQGRCVSIHAPTRGATSIRPISHYVILVSIHAPTRGATFKTGKTWPYLLQFQSTHPHGVRPAFLCAEWVSCAVSIHAPTRGATLPGAVPGLMGPRVSIHAPTRGATPLS